MSVKVNGLSNPAVNSSPREGRLNIGDGPGLPTFDKTLRGLQKPLESEIKNSSALKLKFSNHALDRIRSRGISIDSGLVSRLENAVEKAAQKGAKETLVLTDDSAMIVSVKNRTVVTVMDKSSLKENVFTNIDSTVVL